MARVIAERNRRSIGRADASMRAEDEEFLASERGDVPAHPGILAPAEEVASRPLDQHFRRHWQRSLRAGGLAADVVERRVFGIEYRVGSHRGHNNILP
jgi:hypothetical protein